MSGRRVGPALAAAIADAAGAGCGTDTPAEDAVAIQDDRFSASRRLLRESELALRARTEHLVDLAMRAIGSTRPSG